MIRQALDLDELDEDAPHHEACLDHVIVLGAWHLLHILRECVRYYHESRCHQSLDGNSPIPRSVEPTGKGRVISLPRVGGLHHEYRRAA